jgi:hypothetical protein
MQPMQAPEQLTLFLEYEQYLRSGTPIAELTDLVHLAPYWRTLLNPLEDLRQGKHSGIRSNARFDRSQT